MSRKTGLEKGTILDDFGNVAKLPDGVVEQDPVTGALRHRRVLSERIIERNAGCWNCLHYQTGLVFDMAVAKAHRRDVEVFQTDHQGPDGRMRRAVPRRAAEIKANQTRALLTKAPGIFGVCTGHGVTYNDVGHEIPIGEFVPMGFHCRKWSGVTGASLARAPGEPLSPIMAEEYAKRGENPRVLSDTKKQDDEASDK